MMQFEFRNGLSQTIRCADSDSGAKVKLVSFVVSWRHPMWRLLLVAAFAIPLSGCAGTVSQFLSPAIESDHLDEPKERNKLKTLSGDRRLVRVVAEGDFPKFAKYDICAETQADAISARSAKSALNLKATQSLSDEAAEALTKTVERGELSDVVRQLAWNLCNARLNNDLDEQQYRDALLSLSHNAMVVLQQRALGGGAGPKLKESVPTIGSLSLVLPVPK